MLTKIRAITWTIKLWIYNHMPKVFKAHDFEVFAAILCLTAGIPLLFGKVDASSLEATMPSWFVFAWAGALVSGSCLILYGLYRSTRLKFAYAIYWFRMEAFGLRILSYMAWIYIVAIIIVNHTRAFPAVCLIIVFALTCGTRTLSIQMDIYNFRRGVGLSGRQ